MADVDTKVLRERALITLDRDELREHVHILCDALDAARAERDSHRLEVEHHLDGRLRDTARAERAEAERDEALARAQRVEDECLDLRNEQMAALIDLGRVALERDAARVEASDAKRYLEAAFARMESLRRATARCERAEAWARRWKAAAGHWRATALDHGDALRRSADAAERRERVVAAACAYADAHRAYVVAEDDDDSGSDRLDELFTAMGAAVDAYRGKGE